MPQEELFPGTLSVSLGRRFQAVFLQNVGHRAACHLMAQTTGRSLYPTVPPIPVLRGHADNQLADLILHTGTPRAPLLAAIIFDGDQFAMPSEEGLWCDDDGQFVKHSPPQLLGLDSQAPALVVSQGQPLVAELLAQHAVFLMQVVDDILLLMAHPNGKGNQQQSQWTQGQAHRMSVKLRRVG